MNLLELKNISLRFGGLTALKNVSFSLQQGEILSVIGPNGAGKTSLFNVITGLYEPSEGVVLLLGKTLRETFSPSTLARVIMTGLISALLVGLLINIQTIFQLSIIDHYEYQQPFPWTAALKSFFAFLTNASAMELALPALGAFICGAIGALLSWNRTRGNSEVVASSGLSRTFQNIRLFSQLSALDNVLIGLDSRSKSTLLDSALRLPRFRKERPVKRGEAHDLLQFVAIDRYANIAAEDLSYGDQRRLEIARALARRPKILLLDEPAAGMNPTEASALMELIRKIRDRNITIILIEHHMKVVMGVSDRVVVLDYGIKIAEGTPEQVCKNSAVIEAYLGKGDQ